MGTYSMNGQNLFVELSYVPPGYTGARFLAYGWKLEGTVLTLTALDPTTTGIVVTKRNPDAIMGMNDVLCVCVLCAIYMYVCVCV